MQKENYPDSRAMVRPVVHDYYKVERISEFDCYKNVLASSKTRS